MNKISTFADLVARVAQRPRRARVAVVWAADEHTRQAVGMALNHDLIDACFVGCRQQVMADEQLQRHAAHVSVVDAADSDQAAAIAVDMARAGQVDVIMKGLLNTDNLLHALLHKEHGILAPGAVLTHVTAVEAETYPRLLLFTDAAVIPYPTPEQRHAQIAYVAAVARAMGVEEPRIALVHCSEKVDPRHFPFTADYVTCKEMAAQGDFGPCIVDGPLDVKTACNLHALQTKGLTSPINGEADALVFPDIEAGNTFYKTMTLFCQSETAGMLVGALVPVVLPSRGDSALSKFYSLALAASSIQ